MLFSSCLFSPCSLFPCFGQTISKVIASRPIQPFQQTLTSQILNGSDRAGCLFQLVVSFDGNSRNWTVGIRCERRWQNGRSSLPQLVVPMKSTRDIGGIDSITTSSRASRNLVRVRASGGVTVPTAVWRSQPRDGKGSPTVTPPRPSRAAGRGRWRCRSTSTVSFGVGWLEDHGLVIVGSFGACRSIEKRPSFALIHEVSIRSQSRAIQARNRNTHLTQARPRGLVAPICGTSDLGPPAQGVCCTQAGCGRITGIGVNHQHPLENLNQPIRLPKACLLGDLHTPTQIAPVAGRRKTVSELKGYNTKRPDIYGHSMPK